MIKKIFVSAAVVAALLVSMAGTASATHAHRIETGTGACVDRNGAGFGTGQVYQDNSADPGATTFHERVHKGTPGTFAFERPANPVSVHGGLCPEAVGWLALAMTVGALAGPVAVPVSTVGVLLILPFLPATFSLHVNATMSAWSPAQSWWLVLAILSAALLVASSRDPATSSRLRVPGSDCRDRGTLQPTTRVEDR